MIGLKLSCQINILFLLEKILIFKKMSHVTLHFREEIIQDSLGLTIWVFEYIVQRGTVEEVSSL